MDWEPISEFPGYSVHYEGFVRNDATGRILRSTWTRRQHGMVQVGLMYDGMQYKRGVALLVARAFLEPPALSTFDTPINLDGDRRNNHVSNLMWRPRWFAIKYHRQFYNNVLGFDEPIMDVESGERFHNSLEAATKYGLLDREILTATLNRTYVWPTYQRFRLVHSAD